uniref:KIAA0825 n=1 Tax=Astyanax mexicanus TaxID=7994 RepID=A0A8B9HVI7_ASTMX
MELLGDFPQDHAFVDLLMSDVPGEADLQLLIRDTEDKLKLNASSIEQNLRELQGKIGEAWVGERAPSPTECLQWFSQRNLASLKPISTGHQELLDFLKSVQQLLKTEEAREEAVLQLLLNISSQCGVSFPSSGTLSVQGHTPVPPVCSVRDDLALEVQETWDDIRFLLRRHLLDRLQLSEEPSQTAQSAEGSNLNSRVPPRIHILQQLSFLYPESEVLTKYQALQSRMVLGLLRSTQTCSPGGERGFNRLALGFQDISPAFCTMLSEEIHVLNGVAEPHSILAFLNQAYLSTLTQELSALMEREVEAMQKDNTAPGAKVGKGSNKKSAVEAWLRERLWVSGERRTSYHGMLSKH